MLPRRLAVREVDEVAAVRLGRDERAHEPRARLGRHEPAVADLAGEHLRARRHAVEVGALLEVRCHDAGDKLEA